MTDRIKAFLLAAIIILMPTTVWAATQTISDPWVDGETPTAAKWNSHETTFLSGINNVETDQIVDGTIVSADINASAAIPATKLDLSTQTANVNFDDGSGASPSITFTDETNETAVIQKADSDTLQITTAAADGVEIVTGNLIVGNGTPDETINGEDLYVEGISEFDGAANFDGAVDMDSTLNVAGTVTAQGDLSVNGTTVGTGLLMPSGSVIFMASGACPTGTTDITSTYSDKFVRINSTQLSTGGADTHTHGAGSYAVGSHLHSITLATEPLVEDAGSGFQAGGSGSPSLRADVQGNTGSTAPSFSGTSASGNNVPAYFTLKACQVD